MLVIGNGRMITQDASNPFLENGAVAMDGNTIVMVGSLAAFSFLSQTPAQADILVQDGDTVTLGNTVFTVLATPGHTPGGVCYITEHCIFSGDTLFFCSCGRTDFPGGSSREIMDSLQKLAHSSLSANASSSFAVT